MWPGLPCEGLRTQSSVQAVNGTCRNDKGAKPPPEHSNRNPGGCLVPLPGRSLLKTSKRLAGVRPNSAFTAQIKANTSCLVSLARQRPAFPGGRRELRSTPVGAHTVRPPGNVYEFAGNLEEPKGFTAGRTVCALRLGTQAVQVQSLRFLSRGMEAPWGWSCWGPMSRPSRT